MTTIEHPKINLHDMTVDEFVKVITDIIVTTIADEKCDDAINEIIKEYLSSSFSITDMIVETIEEEKCDDAITEIIKEYLSDKSIMNEDGVEEKIESAIDNIDWQDRIDDAVDWNDRINEAIDENDAFDLDEKVRVALVTQLGDTPTITELRRDIYDLKMECNSLREHNKKSLDMVMSLLELIRAINNK